MRFRGGGISHKATRDWDEFLQREGCEVLDGNTDNDEMEGESEQLEELTDPESREEDGLEESELGDMEEDGGEAAEGEEGEEVNGSDDEDEDEDEDEPGRVIADDEEELDDDILAREGHGAL